MLVIVGILLLFGLVVRHKWRNGAAKKEAILRLVAVASEEEAQIAKLQAVEQYNSQHVEYTPQPSNTQQLEAQHFCAVCRCPTTTRCSRCKAVRYCSGKCQIIHWRQGHRDECQPAVALYATKKSEYVVETAPENQFTMHLKNESKICSDPSNDCDDSGSSGSSTSSFFSSTDQSEASADASTNEDVECRPALALHARMKSDFVVETAPEFAMHLKDEIKISDPSEECDDSGSSGSSVSCFLSSTKQSEMCFDASTDEHVKLGTPTRPDKAPSTGIDSYISETVPYFGDANVLRTSHPGYLVNKIEKTPASKIDESLTSTNLKDKRKGGGVAVIEEFVPAKSELGSPQSTSSARTSSTGDWENLVQTSTSRVMRSKSAKTSGNNEVQNIDLSSEYLKSSKLPQSHEYRKTELCNGKETRSVTMSTSSGDCQKMHTNADSPQAISLETEGVRILSQSTGKGLKTSVRKLAQHFRVPKQTKSYTIDMVKDFGDNHNHKVIFSFKIFMQLYTSDNVGLHPFGLANCGNSCYANAVLQCLIFTRPITSYLLQGLHSKTCRKRDWCFICKFEHLIQKGQVTNSPLSPVGLLSHIQPIGREEDAHEFLRNVVDKMQSICLEEAGVSGSFTEDSTLMGLTFGGYLRSKIKCMKCLGRSEQHDRMLDLTVEIDGDIYTLEQALAQFTSSETLGGDDKYKCNRCKSYEKAKKKLTVLEAPNVLTVVLKRFRSGNFEKLSKLIRFPEVLNLLPYMSGMGDKYPIYHLYAVVVHLGVMNGVYSGHYVSYVKNFQGHWFRIDDSRVSRVDLETVLSEEAYILFYARHSPRGASFVRNSNMYSDGKTKKNMEAIPSSNNSKKKTLKTKLSSSARSAAHWMSPNDFSGSPMGDPEDWEFQVQQHKNHIVDSSSDSSSIFSTSDAGSYSTDSTKDSSAEDLSGYLFGSNWYHP
ncbi:ubiquitin carboxyl-terminal hydrolase 17 [Salvia miltiorrhiza]|uniref:ubiquitin carboxyl-terminal hydrolase 17 n=1 Tax=Salvia miltiorrhiza TaxID=226208 RepID=UPI0025ACAC92|nr:ubiquitin carboxyl-terminal hydrolase 17 [Salvia miltiorrhiza]